MSDCCDEKLILEPDATLDKHLWLKCSKCGGLANSRIQPRNEKNNN